MSGAAVLGIISAVISIVDATSKVYQAAKDETGLPPNFKTVATKLPLISRLLEDAERYVDNEADDALTSTITPVLKDCEEKAAQLQQLFEKVIPTDDDSRSEQYFKAARTIGKGGRVETLMKGILCSLQLLTANFPRKAVSRRGQENLTKAIEEVSELESSLSDGFENAQSFANYGSGAQNVNTGAGSLHSHQNNGPGNQYIGTNHIGSLNDSTAFGDSNSVFQAKTINGPVNYYSAQPAIRHNPEAEEACRCDLFVTDPLEDKKALKRKKGDRVAGTCEWILGTEELIAWLGPSQTQRPTSRANQVLWLHGNPGTGKSTLAIYLTDALSSRFSATEGHTLAYFFCDSAFDTRRTATSVIRGLLLQLIQQHPQLLSHVLPRYKERKAKLFESFDALWTIFISAAADRNTGRKYCVIDALDELDDESQRTLLRQLRDTFHGTDEPPDVRFLVTSRPYSEIRNHLAIFTHKDLASFPDVQHDIDQCIERRVAELKYTKKIKGRIAELLREKAGGTFLWVGIACSELEDTPSKDAISRLKEMPSGLNALYEKLFTAALEKETEKDTIRLVLSFVAVSQRPLTLLELSEACQLCEDEDDIETRIQFMRDYIDSCRLMVVIQDERVLLLHQSVKDFLIDASEQACFSELKAHADLAYRCLDHLVEQFHSSNKLNGHLSDYAIGEWPNHARIAQARFIVKTAQAEFFSVISPCRESWLVAYRARIEGSSSRKNPLPFSILHVSAQWGIPAIAEHISHSFDQNGTADGLVDFRDEADETALDYAVRNGYTTVMHVLLRLRSVPTSHSALLAAENEENGKEVMALLLQQRESNFTITEEVLKAAAGNWGHGRDLMALLMRQRGLEITITENVAKAAARNGGSGKEVMALLLQQRGIEITISEDVLKAAAGNEENGKEVMALLLQQRGLEIAITEDVVKAAAGNEKNGKEVMALLLQQRGIEIAVTEDVVKAAARNGGSGKEVMALLLQQRGIEIAITEDVVKAAARNGGSGKEVMALLLQQRGLEIAITEDVVKAAAGNGGSGKEVMAILLQQRGLEITITEDVVKAAAGNGGSGKEVMAILLQQRGLEITITEDVVKTAAGNEKHGMEVMALLLQQRESDVTITEEVLKAAAGNGGSGKDVMALLLEQREREIKITEEVLKTAAGNIWEGKEIMALLLEQREGKIIVTEEVLKAAAENWRNGKEVMALLLQQRRVEIIITEAVVKAAAENLLNGKEVTALLLEQRQIETPITEELVTIAAQTFDEKMMTLFLEQRGRDITISEEVLKAAAGNWENGKEVMALLLQQRGLEITITEDVMKAAAGNGGSGKEVMALLLQQRGLEITITEDVVKAAAGNENNGKELMALLLQQRGLEITITEDVVRTAAGNEKHGMEVMALLLRQRESDVTITEEVLQAVVGNMWSGKDVMALLLQQREREITVTEEVLKAAAGNWMSGKGVTALLLHQRGIEITITEELVTIAAQTFDEEMMTLLLGQRGRDFTITEEVLKAAARNWWNGKEVMALLLQQQGFEITITEDMMKAAAGNGGSGKEVITLFLQQRGIEITISEDVLKAAAGNEENGKEVMALLLQQRGIEITITEGVLKAAAGNEENGKEVMALLLQQRGLEIAVTEEVVKTAAGNGVSGKEMIALLLQQRGLEITITEDVLKAAAGNEGHGQEIMQLLFEQHREDTAVSATEAVLVTAATCGQDGVLDFMSLQDGLMSASNNHRRIAKFYNAAKAGDAGCIEQLLQEGARPDLRDLQGRTPLWIAASQGHDAIVRILAQRPDVEVNSLSISRRSPLFWASYYGYEKVVAILLQAKADPGFVDVNGDTAVLMARRNGYRDIAKALER